MKNIVFQIVFVLSVISFVSCNGSRIDIDEDDLIPTETYNLDDFDGIILNINANIKLTQGDRQSVIVEGQEDDIDDLLLIVKHDKLIIGFDRFNNHDALTIYITVPDIKYLLIHGSGDINGENVFETKDLDLIISGSGSIDLGLQSDDVKGIITGSGSMKLEGISDDLNFRITGSGNLSGFDLNCSDAEVSISGSGDAEVNVRDNLDVKITGSGDVFFKGNPKVDVRITGSGDVIDAN